MSSLDEGKIAFTFDPICGLDAKKERFVNAFHYEFNGEEPTVMHFVGVVDGVGEGKVTVRPHSKKWLSGPKIDGCLSGSCDECQEALLIWGALY